MTIALNLSMEPYLPPINNQESEFDFETRGTHYSDAHEQMPWVRGEEINQILVSVGCTGPLVGKTILDFACGSGTVTIPLSIAVGSGGVVYAADDSETNFQRLKKKAGSELPITILLLKPNERLNVQSSCVDVVVSLAGMHHVPNDARQGIFVEFYRVLKPGGYVVIGDVLDQRPVQSYFDNVVDKVCSTGHLHRFFDKTQIQELCGQSGLLLERFNEVSTPWIFNNEKEAGAFLRTIHDAKKHFTPEYCLAEAKKYLGCSNDGGIFKLNWSLFFMTAKKQQ